MEELKVSLPSVAGIPEIDASLLDSADSIEDQFFEYVEGNQLEWAFEGAKIYCELP